MKIKLLIVLFIAILFSACNSDRIFHKNQIFEKYNWSKTDTVSYNIDIDKDLVNKNYSFAFDIRYITGYQYKFLNLNILVVCPDGKLVEKTESIQIRKDNSEYIGDVAGSYWDITHVLQDKFEFKQIGEYIVKVSPIVEEEKLYFINELALNISKDVQK